MNTETSTKKVHSKTLSLALIALFAALTAILSQIAIPMPGLVPISLGNLAGFFAIGLLNWKEAAASQAVWVLLGVAGAPVFSGFGSLSRLAGPTGGYIIGFVISALIAGLILTRTGYRFRWLVLALTVGVTVCYAFGTVWYLIVMGSETTPAAALLSCVVPFLPGDAVKIVLASLLSQKLRPHLRRGA